MVSASAKLKDFTLPATVLNWVGADAQPARDGRTLLKLNPATGEELCVMARSGAEDIAAAVHAAREAQQTWGAMSPVRRGEILFGVVEALQEHRGEMARIVALETGKSLVSASGETDGAIALGRFMAAEGQRMYGRTTTSSDPNKWAMTIREPLGVAGLIVAANTPVANVAWKVFPALICGNAAVLKAAEDTPLTAWLFGLIAHDAGLPAGVLNVVQGAGREAGAALVAHPDVEVISFTGSTVVGREIAAAAGHRMARVSLELGGKNPLVVCDDADLDNAVKWVLLSAFSNAGQRCASGSRIVVFESVYERFRDMLVAATKRLRVGNGDEHDLGPVINKRQLSNMLDSIARARQRGANILAGGHRLEGAEYAGGFYLAPTVVEGVNRADELSCTELFGPITALYPARDFADALDVANDSPYGLTACIHTRSFDRALEFSRRVHAGAVVVNGGTYGSEPHMPFGGRKQSGNGSREPGTEALDVYSNLKDVYLNIAPHAV
jgi:alpha-ketoglutaric semialdehyde dehydrogenase